MSSHRRPRAATALSWTGAVVGPACILAGPVLGARWQLGLTVIGVVVIAAAVWWFGQLLADDRAARAATRVCEHIDALAAAAQDHGETLQRAVDQAAAAVVAELRGGTAQSAARSVTRTDPAPADSPMDSTPQATTEVPQHRAGAPVWGRRPPGDTGSLFEPHPSAAQPVTPPVQQPAEQSVPGPLDPGWTWSDDTRAAS